ncbi:MAG: FtsX-like permease family protein [Acidobacteria bacterium]|nr:FtsX-like permease family protein [Acidobacteriota bacterium]
MISNESRFASRILHFASLLVPSGDRRGWREEWDAELHYLHQARRESADAGMPSPVRLALGALPHSLWERKEWTVAVLLQDVRFAARVLRHNVTFTAMAVITLALGIGANTTIFSMTNAMLLRSPDAIGDAARVVQIGRDRPDQNFDSLAYPYYRLFRDNSTSLEAVSAWTSRNVFAGETGEMTRVNAHLVTGEYFEVLGMQPIDGRLLSSADDQVPGGHPVVVVSYSAWQRVLGGDPSVVGSEIKLNNYPYTVAGIAPEGFGGTNVIGNPADVWVPMMMSGVLLGDRYQFASIDDPGMSWLWLVGRLAEDVSPAAARDELDALYQQQMLETWGEAAQSPLGVIAGVGLRPDERQAIQTILAILSAIVGIVLAVACANLANLLLARGVSRSREIGVRVALGAGRVRVVRQLLTESVLLALGGGLVAVVVTFWTARLLPALLPITTTVSFRPDLRVLFFATCVSTVAGIVFGVVPAIRASRPDIVDTLKTGTAGAGTGGGWLRSGLVVGQLALSFVLLASTAFLVRSLWAAQGAEPGFATRTVSTVTFSTGLAGLDDQEAAQLYNRLARDVAALPGVESAGLGSNLPFGGWSRRSVMWPEPRPEAPRPFIELDWTMVTPGFHETLQLPLLAGEPISALNSAADMPRVMLLSQSAAELLFDDADPLGRLVPTTEDRAPESSYRVIGVVADAQMRSLQQAPRPNVYTPVSQDRASFMTIYARAANESIDLAGPLREALATAAPEIGVLIQGSLHQRMAESLGQTTLVARLAGIFGVLAAMLAASGLYGVMAFIASSRRREVGVRMALGAERGSVLRMFVRQAVILATLGVALGTALTLALGGTISNLLYGVAPGDPVTLLAIALAVIALAVIAAFTPAYRATRVAPVAALRQD